MFTQSMPDGYYYREINDAEILRPLMKRGNADVKVFYKLKKFRDESKWREDINVLSNIGWDKGNQFFRTHELLGELCSEQMRFNVRDLQMIQFQGMTFVLFDEAIYDNKGTNINNLLGYRQRWGKLIRTVNDYGEVDNVTLYSINS